MKTYKIFFFDIRLNIDRETTEYATNQLNAEINFQFKNPDYLIFNVEYIN